MSAARGFAVALWLFAAFALLGLLFSLPHELSLSAIAIALAAESLSLALFVLLPILLGAWLWRRKRGPTVSPALPNAGQLAPVGQPRQGGSVPLQQGAGLHPGPNPAHLTSVAPQEAPGASERPLTNQELSQLTLQLKRVHPFARGVMAGTSLLSVLLVVIGVVAYVGLLTVFALIIAFAALAFAIVDLTWSKRGRPSFLRIATALTLVGETRLVRIRAPRQAYLEIGGRFRIPINDATPEVLRGVSPGGPLRVTVAEGSQPKTVGGIDWISVVYLEVNRLPVDLVHQEPTLLARLPPGRVW